MLYRITHRTVYAYDSFVSYSHHVAHLRPRETDRQEVLAFDLEVSPRPTALAPRSDYYGNPAIFLGIETSHQQLTVTSSCRVRVSAAEWPDPGSTPPWESIRPAVLGDVLSPDSAAGEFMFDSRLISRRPTFAKYAAESFTPNRPVLEGILDLTHRIYREFTFDPRATTVATPIEEAFEARSGVCQDFAHLAIAFFRSIGLPARYVSGYLETTPPQGSSRLIGSDVSHAWCSVWCPGVGWIDTDPTNDLLPSDRHVTIAWGRDFSDVSPLRGVVVGGGEHELKVFVDVERGEEEPD